MLQSASRSESDEANKVTSYGEVLTQQINMFKDSFIKKRGRKQKEKQDAKQTSALQQENLSTKEALPVHQQQFVNDLTHQISQIYGKGNKPLTKD